MGQSVSGVGSGSLGGTVYTSLSVHKSLAIGVHKCWLKEKPMEPQFVCENHFGPDRKVSYLTGHTKY